MAVGNSESYDIEVENSGEETIEDAEFEVELIGGDGSVYYDPLDSITLDPEESKFWEDAIEIECEGADDVEVEVTLVGDDGVELVSVTMNVECVPDDPGIC